MKIEFTEREVRNLINALKANIIILNDLIEERIHDDVLIQQLIMSEEQLNRLTTILEG